MRATSRIIRAFTLRRTSLLRVAIVAVPLCACAAVLGIDDGHPRDGEGGSDAAIDTALPVPPSDGAVDSGGAVLPTQPDGAVAPPGCQDLGAQADPSTGLFVAQSGADGPACGTLAAPCKTVQQGINRAHDAAATPNVYVASGTYVEAVTLKSGVNVFGGWTPGQARWSRLCSQLTTILQAPPDQPVTVRAEAIAGSASLSTLSVASKSQRAT